jgi:Fic family protein
MRRIVTACGQKKPRRRTYFRQRAGWPQWRFDAAALAAALAEVHRAQATLQALTQEVITTSAIEGEALSREAVRSSIARRLGVDIGALAPADRHVDGVVDMVLDATQRFAEPLTAERLFGWHAALFPTGYSGRLRIQTGAWRNDAAGPMQVVSGPIGRETVHYEAPPAARLPAETAAFLDWFNHSLSQGDPLVQAGLAHLWLVTLHPFDDGNGRISRAVGDMALARAEGSAQRFYSLSAQIQRERKHYYEQLETTQRGTLDVTPWLAWFLGCLLRAVQGADGLVADVLAKAQFWQRWADAPINARQTLALNRVLGGMEGKLNNAEWAALAKCSRRHTGPPINQSTRPCHQSFHHGLWGMGRTTLVLGSYSQSAGCV